MLMLLLIFKALLINIYILYCASNSYTLLPDPPTDFHPLKYGLTLLNTGDLSAVLGVVVLGGTTRLWLCVLLYILLITQDVPPYQAISREEAQAEEETLSRTRHFRPVVKPTQKKYNPVEDLWRE